MRPSASMASFLRMPATRWRRAAVARAVAAAGLFSSCIRPAVNAPSAVSRSRSPTRAWLLRNPKKTPSSRWIAIGNQSRISVAKSFADSTKKRLSLIARSVAL